MSNPPAERHWYVACRSSDLRKGPLQRSILGSHMALFRAESGSVGALEDRCPHRNAPLSAGRIRGQHLACPYHGWELDVGGLCRLVPGLCGPQQHHTRNVQHYPVHERDGLITLYFTPQDERSQRVFAVAAGRLSRVAAAVLLPITQRLVWSVVRQDAQILSLQRRNLERFGGERYTSTELDLLRPHILRLMRSGGTREAAEAAERLETEVTLLL